VTFRQTQFVLNLRFKIETVKVLFSKSEISIYHKRCNFTCYVASYSCMNTKENLYIHLCLLVFKHYYLSFQVSHAQHQGSMHTRPAANNIIYASVMAIDGINFIWRVLKVLASNLIWLCAISYLDVTIKGQERERTLTWIVSSDSYSNNDGLSRQVWIELPKSNYEVTWETKHLFL